MENNIKKNYMLMAVIILVGVVVRIVKFDTIDLVMDTVVYSRLGMNLIEHGRYAFGENYNMGIFFPPGYPILVGLANLLFNDLFFSAKLVSFVSSIISIFLSYLVGKKLYNKESGLFAALLFAIYPAIIIISTQGYSDAPFICFLLLSLYLFMKSLERENIIFNALLGVIFAATYLIRPEAVFLMLLPVMQVFGVFGETLRFSRKHLVGFIVLFAAFLFTISPYVIFVKNYTGKLSLSGKSNISLLLGELSGDRKYHEIVNAPDNLYDRVAFALNEDKTELMGWNKKANMSFKEFILKNPFEFARRYQKNLLQEIQTLMKLLIPFILPLFFSFFYRDLFTNRSRLIFLFLPIVSFLMYPVFIIIEKQTLMIVIYLLVFSSGGFSNAKKVVSDLGAYYGIEKARLIRFMEYSIRYLMIAVLVIGSLSYLKYSGFQNFDVAHAKPEEHKRAGYFLKDKLSPDYESLNIMSKEPYVSFYSGSRFTMLPYANVNDVINFAKLYHVDYIVVDERSLSKWDYYDELSHMQRYSSDVELFYEDGSERLIKLFKIRK